MIRWEIRQFFPIKVNVITVFIGEFRLCGKLLDYFTGIV